MLIQGRNMGSIGCEFGRYGLNCSLFCGRCHTNTTCDAQGLCPNGCQNGWRGLRCVEVDEMNPYPLSTLLLSGFLAVSLVLLLFVSLELHNQIQRFHFSKKKMGKRLSSYELPGQQLIEKESENRYGILDRYQHIQDISIRAADDKGGRISDYEKAPEISESGGIRDSSHYTVPNMAYNQSDGTDHRMAKIATEKQCDTSGKTVDRTGDNDDYITIID